MWCYVDWSDCSGPRQRRHFGLLLELANSGELADFQGEQFAVEVRQFHGELANFHSELANFKVRHGS